MRDRGVLLGLSYRLLGSLVDAEDVVQETYLRWYRLSEDERSRISAPRAWLITTASRIGLDVLRSARARREHYVGEWLPEPMPAPGRWASHRNELGLVAGGCGQTLAVIAFAHLDGRVAHVWAVRNPEKLHAWRRARRARFEQTGTALRQRASAEAIRGTLEGTSASSP
ncbi:sigma factor [Microbacterium betulae]|uniref:Sigma factor n=1 Tax=Microbacterium betulae TaxID=2981139 RepID=A0AA97FIA2_9MICO|nr:sigma factor [Microbacterium sp. AB]WOF24096.1 sigma factor [Microbacterium sp. AB]